MKNLVVLLALVSACARPFVPAPNGPSTVRHEVVVRVSNCLEPHRTWAAQELESLGAFGVDWRLARADEPATVAVHCSEEPSNDTWAGWYTLGEPVAQVDVERTSGMFEFRAAVGHELVHWYLGTYARHPQRALLHICWFPYNEVPPPGCHASIVAKLALMMPRLLETHTHAGRPGPPIVAQYEPNADDLAFFRWAMGH